MHIMQHYHALDIHVLTAMPKVPSWKRRRGRAIIEAPEQRSTPKAGFYASLYK